VIGVRSNYHDKLLFIMKNSHLSPIDILAGMAIFSPKKPKDVAEGDRGGGEDNREHRDK
jgi:hypothetical protein